jgi:hypothetical protein
MMDGTFAGTVDRVVDDTTAVILVEDGGEVVEQATVPVEDLPGEDPPGEDRPDQTRDGRRLSLTFRNGELVSMADGPATREREESLQERFDRLSTRLSEE